MGPQTSTLHTQEPTTLGFCSQKLSPRGQKSSPERDRARSHPACPCRPPPRWERGSRLRGPRLSLGRAVRGLRGGPFAAWADTPEGPPPLPSFAVGQSEGTATVSGRARVGPLRPCPGGLRPSRRPRPEPPPSRRQQPREPKRCPGVCVGHAGADVSGRPGSRGRAGSGRGS